MHGAPDTAFAAYISFYAPCHIRLREEEDLVDKPTRIFMGTADDLVPVANRSAWFLTWGDSNVDQPREGLVYAA